MTYAEAWKELELSGEVKMIDLKNAYRKMAKKCHPDKGGTVEMFNKLKQAYDLLIQTFIEKKRRMTQVPQQHNWVRVWCTTSTSTTTTTNNYG